MPNEANPETGATSIDAAVATGLFGGMMGEAKQPPKAKEPEEEQPESAEGQPETEPQGEVEAAEEAQAEPAEEQEDQAEEEAAEPADIDLSGEGDRSITLTVDGKPVRLKLSEAAKGFQLHADYTRKTSELAEQRKTLEAERTQWGTERQSHAETLKKIHLSVQQMVVGSPPSIEMLDAASPKYDPNNYHLLKAQFEQRARAFTAQLQELDRIEGEERTKLGETRRQSQANNRAKLIELVPDFADSTKAKALVKEIHDDLSAAGFTDQEIRQVGDPRMVSYIVNAIRGRKTKAGIEAKRVAPKAPLVVKPSAGKAPNQAKATRVAAAKGNHSKERSVASAARYFASLKG